MANLTILEALRKARDLVSTGEYSGIMEAVSALKPQASGLTRDCVYYALLDTAAVTNGDVSFALLNKPDGAVKLFDATIARLAAALH